MPSGFLIYFITHEEDLLKGWHCGLQGQSKDLTEFVVKNKISTVHF